MAASSVSLKVQNLLAFGNIVIRDGIGPEAIAPRLGWGERKAIMQDGEPDLFAALQWKYSMAPTLQGRDAELQSILDWADDGNNTISVRLLSGGGGSGKTRLAAEAAKHLRDRGWVAGFVPRNAKAGQAFETSLRKFLLIFDYPEERMDVVKDLFDSICDISDSLVDFPIRILLVSRREWADWADLLRELGPRAGRQELSVLRDLPRDDAQKLFDETARNFAELTGKAVPDPGTGGQWLEAPANRVPLITMAGAVHHVLSGDSGFGLGASGVLQALADTEFDRARRVSADLGLGDLTLPRLLALAALTQDGLTDEQCEALGDAQAASRHGQDLIDRLKNSPWRKRTAAHEEFHLTRPEPDRMAATFLGKVLLDDASSHLPDWLAIVAGPQESAFGDVISRVGYDLLGMPPQWFTRFEDHLSRMLDRHPELITAFLEFACQEGTVFSAGFSAAVLRRVLKLNGLSQEIRAASLNNLANDLSKLGQREQALEAAKEAVALRRELADARPEVFTPDLAASLGTLALRLSELGQRKQALEAAREAVALIIPALQQHPMAFQHNAKIMMGNYVRLCEELEQDPDPDLLAPALQIIKQLTGPDS